VPDPRTAAEVALLFLPRREQRVDARDVQLRQRQVVARCVTDDARDPARGLAPVEGRRGRGLRR